MNFTFLIGNGFDIRMGLKTKFSDFYDTYIQNNKDTDDPYIIQFCKELESDRNNGIMYQTWADFEKAFPKYVTSLEQIKHILADFSEKFYLYLKNLEESIVPITDSMSQQFKAFALDKFKKTNLPKEEKMIEDFFKSFTTPIDFNFINFNYTHTLELLIQSLGDKSDSFHEVHIHGSIDENIIIGIDNIGQLNLLKDHEKHVEQYCVKSEVNNLCGNNHEFQYEKILAESDIVIAYGVSFGESDLSRWLLLKEWLLRDGAKNILFVYQYSPEFVHLSRAFFPTYFDQLNKIKSDFLHNFLKIDYSDITEDLLSRVCLRDSAEVLDFKLVEKRTDGYNISELLNSIKGTTRV